MFSKKFNKKFLQLYNRARLRNKDFTIIANTCIGGILSHELNLKFLSPTVNVGVFNNEEFFTLCQHLKYYMTLEHELIGPTPDNHFFNTKLYGKYGDITFTFGHFNSVNEITQQWEKRKKRINYNNIFIIMDGDNCSDRIVGEFNNLPYKNKVIITKKAYPDNPSVFAITNPNYHKGDILKYGLMNESARWFELFDYVHFFNTGNIRTNALFRHYQKAK